MLVLIEGKVYKSDAIPIMILLSKEEIAEIKRLPDSIDIHCAFPKSWGEAAGKKWMYENKKILVREKEERKSVVTDEEIRNLLKKERESD